MRYIFAIVFLAFAISTFAKRLEPQPVRVIHYKGITYSVPPFILDDKDDPNGGFLEARDSKDQLLWRVQIYKTRYNPLLEQDVQDIFITSLSLDKIHDFLLLADEDKRIFAVDISTRKVTRLK